MNQYGQDDDAERECGCGRCEGCVYERQLAEAYAQSEQAKAGVAAQQQRTIQSQSMGVMAQAFGRVAR